MKNFQKQKFLAVVWAQLMEQQFGFFHLKTEDPNIPIRNLIIQYIFRFCATTQGIFCTQLAAILGQCTTQKFLLIQLFTEDHFIHQIPTTSSVTALTAVSSIQLDLFHLTKVRSLLKDSLLIYSQSSIGRTTSDQVKFNWCISRMRVKVENAIGLIKMRWRALIYRLRSRSIRMKVRAIIAAVVLHNIALLDNDDFERICSEDFENIVRGERQRHQDYAIDTERLRAEEDLEMEELERRVNQNDEYEDHPLFMPGSRRGTEYRDNLCRQLRFENVEQYVPHDHTYYRYLV